MADEHPSYRTIEVARRLGALPRRGWRLHAEHRGPMRQVGWLLAVLVLGVLLAWLLPPPSQAKGIAGYEPLHTLLETVAIVIASLVFATGWNARSRDMPAGIVLLACAFLGVAVLDLSHAMSFAGMPDYVTPSDPEKAVNFWLAARLLAALALLLASAAPWRPWPGQFARYGLLAGVLGLAALAHWLFLFHPGGMPRTFIAGSGLTRFKILAEYTLIALNLAAALVLWLRMRSAQPFRAEALFAAVCAAALSEVFFTLYASVTDVYNLLGHVYKVIAYLFLYRAIVVETIERPYSQLSAAQAQLRATLQAVPDLLWVKDVDGVYLDCNPVVERMLGRTRAQIVGRPDSDFEPPEQVAKYRDHDRRALALGGPSRQEEWLSPLGQGEPGLYDVAKTPMYDAQGRLLGLLGIARDITASRRDQEALRASEQRLQQAARVAQIGIFDHDHLAGAIYISPELRRIFGLSADEVLGLTDFADFSLPEDRPRIDAALRLSHDPAGDGQYDLDHGIRRRDGSLRHLSMRAQTLFAGSAAERHAVRTLGAVLDITERKAAERALLLRDKALRSSFNAVVMADNQGRLTYVNDAFLQLWHLDAEGQALGRAAEDFWKDPAQARGIIQALQGGAASWRGEMVGRRHDGSLVDVAIWATPATGGGGEPLGLMAAFLDITERKQAQAELQQLNATLEARVQARTGELEAALSGLRQAQDELVRSEKMASLGSLVAGVAHDLNTPIGNAVLVASTLSGRQREFEAAMAGGLRRSSLQAFLDATRQVSEVLERNLLRAAELIGSFRQIAVDQSSYQRRSFDLAGVVQEIALTLSPTLRHRSITLVDETPPGLQLDSFPGPLGQVLINLVNNAVVHAFEGSAGGTVRISAVMRDAGHVRICVRDNGRGIAPEHLKQLFDPFFTTRLGQGGSGLGLHIVYTLVTGLLGGRVEVRSTWGEGAEFSLDLPLHAPQTAEAVHLSH